MPARRKASMARRGRPTKPYPASWGEDVQGLTQCGDGRWRIVATEQRFTEPDERRAVERFKEMTGQARKVERVAVEAKATPRQSAKLVGLMRFNSRLAGA